ncbi:hypothetical protein BDZ88DRAFT_442945 [Geranomyces variabilis]|nr:hypothetical protein BDZ88DRAFT_442945 [Geranomyces variabilis]
MAACTGSPATAIPTVAALVAKAAPTIRKLKDDGAATAHLVKELAVERAVSKKVRDEKEAHLHELQDARTHAAAATATSSDHGSSDAGIVLNAGHPDNGISAEKEGDLEDAEAVAQRQRRELEASNEHVWNELMEKILPLTYRGARTRQV